MRSKVSAAIIRRTGKLFIASLRKSQAIGGYAVSAHLLYDPACILVALMLDWLTPDPAHRRLRKTSLRGRFSGRLLAQQLAGPWNPRGRGSIHGILYGLAAGMSESSEAARRICHGWRVTGRDPAANPRRGVKAGELPQAAERGGRCVWSRISRKIKGYGLDRAGTPHARAAHDDYRLIAKTGHSVRKPFGVNRAPPVHL